MPVGKVPASGTEVAPPPGFTEKKSSTVNPLGDYAREQAPSLWLRSVATVANPIYII